MYGLGVGGEGLGFNPMLLGTGGAQWEVALCLASPEASWLESLGGALELGGSGICLFQKWHSWAVQMGSH